MTAGVPWRSAGATHPGRVRSENQDRSYVDDARGVFLVVDGLGGHAGGEKAAETAVEVIRAEFETGSDDVARQAREAIARANNAIFELGDGNEQWRGMACVLTLAVMRGEQVTVGHVGDSRLYLAWNGSLRKLTADHSPVGESEDAGELTEEQAMHHSRRHEVFRDVGSRRREASDGDFIDMKEFSFKPDAALLLCSDGLSDLITSAQMSEIIERYEGDPQQVAAELVDAANRAGGKDNITAIFVAGPDFRGIHAPGMADARARHAITRARHIAGDSPGVLGRIGRALIHRAAFLVYGFVLGVVLALAWR